MPYLGNEPAVAYTSTTKDSFSGDASTTDFTMSKSANVNAVRVVVENVVQNPTVAYTCSGTTLTFTSAPPTGTNNIYVVHLGPPAATVAPPSTINNPTTFTGGVTLKNETPEDTDGGRESIVTFQGTQSGSEISTLAQIQASHDATADDQKGDLIFKTNDGSDGTSPTERLRIDSAGVTTFTGNIANTSGDLTLDVVGDIKLDADGGDIRLLDDGTQFGKFTRDSGDFKISSSENDKDIIFLGADGGSDIEAMRIDMSVGGYVGLGTSAPLRQLSISNSTNAEMSFISGTSSNASILFGDGLTGADVYRGYIQYEHANNAMAFATNAVERMRLTSANLGPLLVGTTSDPSGSERIVVSATSGTANGISVIATDTNGGTALVCRKSTGNSVGSVSFNNNNTAFNTSSDYRLKENVTNVSDGITRVKQLAPKRFNWIDDDSNTAVDGFLAHEVQTVVPEAITGAKDEVEVWKDGQELPDGVSVGDNKLDDDGNTIPVIQNIDQSKLVPLLAAALQEAIAKIETLETKVAALEAG